VKQIFYNGQPSHGGKKQCLSYQEFQNKEEFEDIQGGNKQYICKVQHVLFALFLFVYVEW
jgi:hypothetical protein